MTPPAGWRVDVYRCHDTDFLADVRMFGAAEQSRLYAAAIGHGLHHGPDMTGPVMANRFPSLVFSLMLK